MAQESCDINKDEAEILKSSPSSSSTPPPPPVAAATPLPQFVKPSQQLPIQRQEIKSKDQATHVDSQTLVRIHITKGEDTLPRVCRSINRCSGCQKKVGLTGFRCRCGEIFCGLHRYSDAHDCSFDYKAAGREAISKANPVVRAAKIIKI